MFRPQNVSVLLKVSKFLFSCILHLRLEKRRRILVYENKVKFNIYQSKWIEDGSI